MDMFELIKKWLTRPIVVNFTVEPLSQVAAINVIKCEKQITPEIAKAVIDAWHKFHKSKAIVLCQGLTLEQLTDEQLKDIGLIRADFGSDQGKWTLKNSESVISANTNVALGKYLKDSASRGS